jgi:uncharacterized Zn finger protein
MKTTISFSANNFKAMIRRKVKVYQLNAHGFTVPSTSVQGKAYFVSVAFTRDGLLDVRCNCAAGKARTGCCHGLAVTREFERDLGLVKAIMPQERKAA